MNHHCKAYEDIIYTRYIIRKYFQTARLTLWMVVEVDDGRPQDWFAYIVYFLALAVMFSM